MCFCTGLSKLIFGCRPGGTGCQRGCCNDYGFLGALLTGLGVYDNIVKVGGAGAIGPITGFANSIVAPALEFKREGFVYGVGARMFTIAGPVLVYGFLTSIIIGLLRFILG